MRFRWYIPLVDATIFLADRYYRLRKKKGNPRIDIDFMFGEWGSKDACSWFGNALLEHSILSIKGDLGHRPLMPSRDTIFSVTGREQHIYISQIQLIAATERIDWILIDKKDSSDGVRNKIMLRWIDRYVPIPRLSPNEGTIEGFRLIFEDGVERYDPNVGLAEKIARRVASKRKPGSRKTNLRGYGPHKNDWGIAVPKDKWVVTVPADMVYEWKRESIWGMPDEDHISDMEQSGWKAVPAKRHPKLPNVGGKVIWQGLLLMEKKYAAVAAAREEDLKRALNQKRMTMGESSFVKAFDKME